MPQAIKYLAEPKQLLLAWQAPDHLRDRHRWAVGVFDLTGTDSTFRYVTEDAEFRALNGGRGRGELVALGFLGYPAFSTLRSLHTQGVLQTLMRRLPPRNRSDFGAFLMLFGFTPDANPSDFALLSYTGAKLPSDGFSIVDPLDKDTLQADLITEIAGTRHHLAGEKLTAPPEAQVTLTPEPENKFDPEAIRVDLGLKCIGYINRLQSGTLLHWLKTRSVVSSIYRLNGSVESPKVFIFIKIRPLKDRIAA